MYLPDGADYLATYEPLPDGVRGVAIGWLDAHHPFTVGVVSGEFVGRLFEACRSHATAHTRGWHRCELCDTRGRIGPMTVSSGGQSVILGHAEIRVLASDRTWLVAPTLVLHYVTSHDYLPPPEFIEAIVESRFAS